jgi:hypothetical protein
MRPMAMSELTEREMLLILTVLKLLGNSNNPQQVRIAFRHAQLVLEAYNALPRG